MTFRVANTFNGDSGANLYEDSQGRFHWQMGAYDSIVGPYQVPEVVSFGGQSDPTRVESMPAHMAGSDVALSTNATKFMLATVPPQISGATTLTVTTMWSCSTSTAAVGGTLCRMGLYTISGSTATLVARTANDATIWSSASTVYSRTFDTTGGYPASVTLNVGQRIGLAMLFVGTTPPTVAGVNSQPTAVTTVTPVRCWGNITGQADLATSQAYTSNASAGNAWIGVS